MYLGIMGYRPSLWLIIHNSRVRFFLMVLSEHGTWFSFIPGDDISDVGDTVSAAPRPSRSALVAHVTPIFNGASLRNSFSATDKVQSCEVTVEGLSISTLPVAR